MKFTKRFKLKSNTSKLNKLKAEITTIINEGGSCLEILNIESQIKELAHEDVAKALKNHSYYRSVLFVNIILL